MPPPATPSKARTARKGELCANSIGGDRGDDDVLTVAAEWRSKRTWQRAGFWKIATATSREKSCHMLCFCVLQPTTPTTGSRGRIGAAEKLVKVVLISWIKLVNWVGFLLVLV